jgi:hypothetical protein
MTKTFIIIDPDPIVRMDVEGTLIGQYPDCTVVVGASLQDIGPAINVCGPDTTLFIKSTLVLESADLLRVVKTAATRGSHVVIIGQREELDVPATFVDLPFTTDMVIAAVDPDVSGSREGTAA